jgi:hypothetical protein
MEVNCTESPPSVRVPCQSPRKNFDRTKPAPSLEGWYVCYELALQYSKMAKLIVENFSKGSLPKSKEKL